MQVKPSSGGQYHNCVHPLMGLHWPDHSWNFFSDFSRLFLWDSFIMRFHGVNLLCLSVKLDGPIALFVSGGAVLIFLVQMMHSEILRVFLKEFSLFRRVPGECNRHVFFAPISELLRWPEWFLLLFTTRPLLGLDGKADYPLVFLLPRLTRSTFDCWVFWEGAPPSYYDSAVSMRSNMLHISL